MKHNKFVLDIAKVTKSIKNIFKKVLADEKSLCIFALGFWGRPYNLISFKKRFLFIDFKKY
jgi:hypothetical protein